MKTLYKNLCFVILSLACLMPTAFGVELKGNISVNQTSDTAARAKVDAMNYARRQILLDVLSQYATREYLGDVLQNASDDELMDLIVSTSVSNEQISADTYSANVMMVLDNEAVKKWLNDKDIQNWVPSVISGEKFTAFIVVQNGVSDWAELKRIVRADNIEMDTKSINGNQIFVKLPLNYRSKFTVNIRNAGWKYTDNGGILQIWK